MLILLLEAHQVPTIKKKTYFLGKIIIIRKGKTINKRELKIPT
jgi:hypothetical protein